MNRRFYILTLLTLACCFLMFTLYPSFQFSRSMVIPYRNETGRFGNKAFATVLSDPTMIQAALVSIYSLSYATNNDIIVLLANSSLFTPNHIEQLELVGAKVVETTSSSNHAIVKLWALFDYQKIIYFSPCVLFEKNVNQLLKYPTGSAKVENQVSLLVIEPSPHSFELLARNQDMTFLYLLEQTSLINYKLRLTDDHLHDIAQIYNGPMKPWNFHSYSNIDWKKHYDPYSFYKWRSMDSLVQDLIHPSNNTPKNKARQNTVCDAYLKSIDNITYFPIKDKFSVMISTYNPERIQHLSLLIKHFLKSKQIHTVFITWHNIAFDLPTSLYDDIEQDDYSRIKVLKQSFDSLNNRFNPSSELVTEAVYIVDDDIYVDIKDLEFTFTAWKQRKDSVVGHFPRLHTYDSATQFANYRFSEKGPFSIILTKSMFIRSDYLFSYTCLLDPKLHLTIDAQLNCEDLGFSMMAAGLSGVGPSYVRTMETMRDFGLQKGISTNTAHMPARAKCISDFITDYWNKKDPLLLSFDSIAPYVRPKLKSAHWSNIENIILN